MPDNQIEVIDCVIRVEIKDWFAKHINETCGPDVQIRYQSNGGHFNTHINVEIRGTKSQIDQAAEMIRNASDKTRYTLPWISENTYYTTVTGFKKRVKDQMKNLKHIDTDFVQVYTQHPIINIELMSFSFRPNISHEIKKKINEIFERLTLDHPLLFIYYPTIRTPHTQSSNDNGTTVLNALHGNFLPFLNFEDVFALELANKRPDGTCFDMALDHDIQMFLRKLEPRLYGGPKYNFMDLKNFKINDVLCYFLDKFQDRLNTIIVADTFTPDELHRLSSFQNIQIVKHNITHIDFKSTNDVETVDFCAIYLRDPNGLYISNYGPIIATENYSIHFRADCSLKPLQCNKKFVFLVFKSQINCSPEKTNSVLQYLTTHFEPYQNRSILMLYEFDLNHASNEIISSLLAMMGQGRIEFHEMSFNLKTLITILSQSDQNQLEFKKCTIVFQNAEAMSNKSTLKYVRFFDMEFDLNVLSILKNIERLIIDKCRIVHPSSIVSINMENVNKVEIRFSSFDVSTTRRLMNGLQCVEKLSFQCCHVTPSDHFNFQDRCFTVRNEIFFENMNFGIRTLFRIIENCEIQNQLEFRGCNFQLENPEPFKFSLKPVKIVFCWAKFQSVNLLTILKTLNDESIVFINESHILHSGANPDGINNLIQLKSITFFHCQIETQILLGILSKMYRNTEVWIWQCVLLQSNATYSNVLTNLFEINFRRTKINSQDLLSILGNFKDNSSASFNNCEIIGDGEVFPKINLQKGITIYFGNMTVPSCIARSLIQNDCTVHFDNFTWDFMTKVLSNISIKSNVILSNMKFDSYQNLNSLVNWFTKTKLTFVTCEFIFKPSDYPFLNKPCPISFDKISIDLDVLVTIIEIISEQLLVSNKPCNSNQMPSRRPIKITNMSFEEMSLEIETILRVLENCTSLSQLVLNNCVIVCSNPNELLSTKLKSRIPRLPLNENPNIKKCVDELYKLPEIRFHNTRINSQDLFDILHILKKVVEIYVSNCDITNDTINLQSPNIVIKPTLEYFQFRFKDATLTVKKILYLLNNFISLTYLSFDDCNLVWSNPSKLLDMKLNVNTLHICNMDIDVQIFYTFVQKCNKGMTVTVNNCKITSARYNMLSYGLIEIGRLELEGVPYSPELLQMIQYLNGQCKVIYDGQLTNQAITDICTKSSVHGKQLILTNQICDDSIYFELFAEFFRPIALDLESDAEVEYDLPTYIIPEIRSNCSKYNWDQFKFKFVSVNDATVKLEFLMNGKVIDLFYELNNLSDDSDECVVDYY